MRDHGPAEAEHYGLSLVDAETCGHAGMKAALGRVLRAHLPDGVRRYVASLYEMEPDVSDQVAQFIDAGSRSGGSRTLRMSLVDAETCGHADVKAALARVLRLRAQWPDGVKRYVASMYEMEPAMWGAGRAVHRCGITVRLKPNTTDCCWSTPKRAGMPT